MALPQNIQDDLGAYDAAVLSEQAAQATKAQTTADVAAAQIADSKAADALGKATGDVLATYNKAVADLKAYGGLS